MPTLAQIQDTIYTWVQTVTSVCCIWEDLNVKESELTFPYLSMKLLNISTIGGTYKSMADDTGVITITENKEALLSINAYSGINDADPMSILNTLVDSLALSDIHALIRAADMVIIKEGTIQNISAILNDKSERRANVSFVVRWANVQTDTTGVIESVEIENTAVSDKTEHVDSIIIDITP